MNSRLLPSSIFFLAIMVTSMRSFADPSVDLDEVLRKCHASYARVNDYTCLLHRRDVVNGVLKEHTTVHFKFKKPSRYYMMWPKDRIEAIYAEGRYKNRMVIHGGLLFKFVSVAVDPETALKYNRHTIREADIGRILTIVETNYRKATANADAAIALEGEERLDGRRTWLFKAVFPPGRDYYGHTIFINIDKELYLPIKIKVFGWDQELLEEYYYEGLKLNVGLKEEDFDIDNSKYSFKLGY